MVDKKNPSLRNTLPYFSPKRGIIKSPPAIIRTSMDAKSLSGKTLPPVFSHSGSFPISEEQIRETDENAEEMSQQIRAVAKPSRLPNLADLFTESDAFVEEAFQTNILPVQQDVAERAVELAKTKEEVVSPKADANQFDNVTELKEVDQQLEKAGPTDAPIVLETAPEIVSKKTWFEKIRETAGRAGDAVMGIFKKHWRGVAVAAGITAAAGTTGVIVTQNYGETSFSANVSSSVQMPETQTVNSGLFAARTIPSLSSSNVLPPAPQPVVKIPKLENPVPPKIESRTFPAALENSRSFVVQDIIHKGEVKLSENTPIDTMISSFRGLATNDQIQELNKLQKSVNLGISVYFNEHFGTTAKIAESLKNPKLKNLYRTALAEKNSGRLPSFLTKEKFPLEYQLAEKIFTDCSELGLDESASSDAQVQNFVIGNMFQAKLPGDILKLRKADGSYHVILEKVFEIFDGKAHALLQNTNLEKENGYTGQTEERGHFEKNHILKLQLPFGLNNQQVNASILSLVTEKIASLHPAANRGQIEGLVKRFGFIAFNGIQNEQGGQVTVTLNRHFHKILEPILKTA